MMTTLLVARHGETDWNRDKRWLGQVDRPLTDLGREQARALGKALAGEPISVAYASDLSRALETAKIALEGRGVEVTPIRDLRERSLGAWEGVAGDELAARFPVEFAKWKSGESAGADDAEPFGPFAERVMRAVRLIATSNPDATVLVVAHSGPMRAIEAAARGLDYATAHATLAQPANGAVARYEMIDGKPTRVG